MSGSKSEAGITVRRGGREWEWEERGRMGEANIDIKWEGGKEVNKEKERGRNGRV